MVDWRRAAALLVLFSAALEVVECESKYSLHYAQHSHNTLNNHDFHNFYNSGQYREFAKSEDTGLFTEIFNLATKAIITANATCGTDGPESYCKLVEHVYMRMPQCDVCDPNAVGKRHPIEHAIDGTNQWWQSPSLSKGLQYEWVTITLDLRQHYQVAYVIVKSAIAPRPGTWVLERSLDGITYMPWQYFVTEDLECMRSFGVPATIGVPRFKTDDEVICTSFFSKLDPIENGEVHTSLVNGRPGITGPSIALQNFTRARYVRLRLQKLRTLNADLMIISRRHNTTSRIDQSVTRRYFYSIKDISIGGQCICYGHAERCPADPVTGQLRCECRHNTCGESCDRCCPLYNQLPWRQGTNTENNVCQACQCHSHATECVYDPEIERLGLSATPEGIFEGGGKCIDCMHNTEGINCEKCKPLYFRPSGVSHYREDACRPCDCDLLGSVDGNCIRDDTSAVDELKPGDCVCKPGFGGRRCDRCAAGYRNHPTCEPCPCNQAGSVNFDTCEEDSCMCKSNVEGVHCDRCKPGTINLDVMNPLGCQPCFCFGITEKCSEYPWGKGEIRQMLGWKLTDSYAQRDVAPNQESGDFLMFNVNDSEHRSLYYWRAPKEFTGNLLNSYAGTLQYYVYFVPGRTGQVAGQADVVIEGNGIKIEHYSQQQFFGRENISMHVKMHESDRWYNSQTRRQVDKHEFMRALADVEVFLVRAMYHQEQVQSSIYGLSLDVASTNSNSEHKMKSVEKCECQPPFAGDSCESCVAGYRRVNNQLFQGTCEKCECQDHSQTCDPFTGHCLDCQHYTTGRRCENCQPGHYGNPSLGGLLGACRPCGCPLTNPENNFSTSCSLASLVHGGPSSEVDDYVCTACEAGYQGNKCEMCADGYFGDPMAVNGSCQVCECNGNVDPMAIGNCDSTTGHCLKCIGHTTGDHCELCKENHYGSALTHSCHPCNCHVRGSEALSCDNSTGACKCNEFYQGLQCSQCVDGHGDIENGCPACACNVTGSTVSTQCNEVSGQCSCKPGVFGKHCDSCRTGYFNFTDRGCHFCQCSTDGSVDDGSCNNVTGQCICRQYVFGTSCSECEKGYFNITSGTGCHACKCDAVGADGDECDLRSGQCRCRPGVTGLKCDKCAPNHYGLDESGCKQCQRCPAPGHVCDSVSGDCVCPPNTVGEMCENCTEHAWNHHPLKGCQECECNSEGAVGAACNLHTGQCTCRDEYVGLKCDMCTHGHFNFPTCEKCLCNVGGTDSNACNADGVCLCDEKGQCPCKKSVQGLKCDQCTAQSFSLEKANPAGCTDCFCFNHTNFCVQSSYVWQQIYAGDRSAKFQQPWEYYTERYGLRIFKEHPARFNSYPTDATPLYWPLSRHLLGDRIASYNGFIRFKIANEDTCRGVSSVRPDERYFRYYPMVVLVGNERIILEYFGDKIADDGKYRVRLREDVWRSRSSPEIPVTRKQLMVALQNVQSIYIRGTYTYNGECDSAGISEVSLDVAVWDNTTDVVNTTAIGVETCGDCPQGYSGMSCQNPAEGYCRHRKPDYLNSEDDFALIGWSEPCGCHGHSNTCGAENCRCTNCEHNTFGDYCQYCLPGYHGDARDGHPGDCKKCACPLVDNSFSETCRPVPDGRGYVCDACKPGYTGVYCESCIDGYFGNPNVAGGFCGQCDCHPDGSLNGRCDVVTGQCQCRQGVTGRDCSMCQARHAFMGGVCTSCDQGCTKELMTMVDELETELSAQNFTGLVPIPWKRLYNVGNSTADLRDFLDGIKTGESGAKELIHGLGDQSKYLAEAKGVVDQAKFVLERINKSHGTVNELIDQANDINMLSGNIHRKATDLVNQLRHFTSFGGGKRSPSTVETWLVEAREHLEQTKVRDVHIDKRYNRATVEVEKAKELLKKILSRKLNDTTFEILLDQLNKFSALVEDYRDTVWDDARADIMSAAKISQVSEKSLHQYKQVVGQISDLLAEARDGLTEGENSVAGAKEDMLLSIYDNYREVNDTLFPALEAAAEKCAMQADQHGQLMNEYRVKYVQQSQIHADKLQVDASRLQNSFRSTKIAAENPISASNAYADIVGALKNATDASVSAKTAADAAFDLASSESDDSMVHMAEGSLNVSLALLSEAGKLSVSDLEGQREGFKTRLGNVNEDIIAGRKREDDIRDQYQTFDDQHDRMTGVIEVAQNAESRASETKTEVDKLAADIDAMSQRVSKLKEFTGQGIRDVTDKVREAGLEVASAQEKLQHVQTQANANDALVNTLSDDLTILKEKIKEAREKASRIRISVKSNEETSGFCRRSYMSPASPTPSNVISVKYRPVRDVYDSLIFITKTKSRRTQPSEHMALELRQQRIVFHWNIGGGNRMITNTFPITYIPQSARNTWYHIDVKRKGDSAMLTVAKKQTLPGDESKDVDREPTAVEHAFQGNGDVIFNTQPGETLLSLGSEVDLAALAIETKDFHGVVGELSMDEQTLPLWGFADSNDQCQGAVSPAAASSISGHMFRDGYAEVQMSLTERPTDSMITVFFAAYSPDGLIYFRGSQENGDFISLELRNGSVVFKFYLGGESSTTVQSKKKSYNDGRTHTIRAIRNKQEGHLQVDSETDRVTADAPGKNSALNVGDGNHFVGGVPASFNISKWDRFDIHWRGFFGCISSVKPSQFNELDLDNPVRSQRKQPGCLMDADRLHTTDRVIGFPHPGYFVVSGISMSANSSLAFDFRTREPNATLLFQSSRLATYHRREREASEGQGYLAFYLYQGYLVAHLGTDAAQRSKLVTLRTDARLNDGQLHAVFLSRDGEMVKLMVNDRLMANGTLTESAEIGSARAQMFIGGFPEKVKPTSNEIPSSVPLIGCISDIYLNFKRVPLIPEVHNATIGMCKVEDVVKPATDSQAEEPLQADGGGDFQRTADRLSVQLAAPTVELRSSQQVINGPFSVQAIGSNLVLGIVPRPLPPLPTDAPAKTPIKEDSKTTMAPRTVHCTQPPLRANDGLGAARFGVSSASHFRVTFPQRDSAPNYENFSLSFSFRTSKPNGILWMWANYKNYTRYFNMSLVDGHVELTIKGHKDPVFMRIHERRMDDNHWHMVKVNKMGKELRLQVDEFSMTEKRVPNPKVVRRRMFVGGILSAHERLLKERDIPGWDFPGFDGCMRDFVVDQKSYDLLDPAYTRDVLPCTKPTNSSYVHEEGFLTFDAPTYQGDVLQLGVEFRSGKADGWILALLSNQDPRTRIGLRMAAGKIVFQVVINEVQKYLHEYDTETPACDGKWHHVSVTLDGEQDTFLSILDGDRVSVPLEGALSRTDLKKLMGLPLHVGGLTPTVTKQLGSTSLQGCFGRLLAGGADLAMESARRNHKVLLNECIYKEKRDN